MSSRTAWAVTERNPVSRTQKKNMLVLCFTVETLKVVSPLLAECANLKETFFLIWFLYMSICHHTLQEPLTLTKEFSVLPGKVLALDS